MQLKINSLKSSINVKYILLSLALFANLSAQAQEETQILEKNKIIETNNVNPFTRTKVDGVAAVVGDFIVLDSDIDKTFQQLKAQGISTEDITRCQLFGKLMEDKLYAHHAIQDSIEVSDIDIRSYVDQQINQFLPQVNGSMDRLLEIYNKDDEKSLREEMFEINKNQQLASKMQAKIVEDVEVTPEEVRQFFNNIPEDERPRFGTELKVAQILIEPRPTLASVQKVIDQLKQIKEDVVKGSSFAMKAVLYSQDEGSRGNGGKYTLNRKRPRMVKEFRDVAFSLQEGEVSEPFKTDFGYHIIQLDKIRGQEYDVRHIVIKPDVDDVTLQEANEKLKLIRKRIVDGELTFSDAAREFSDEKETREDGGQLINPETQDYSFELTRMDPELYSQIQDLNSGEVSQILEDQDRIGNKKYKILTVTDRIDEHEADFARDYLKIKELALQEKQFKEVSKWQDEKIKDTYIKVIGDYRDCEFSSNWLKLE